MKLRALLVTSIFLLCASLRAAIISDNILDATGAPELGPNDKGAIWTFTPMPAHVVGLQLTSGRVIQVIGDSKGNFTVSLVQGNYQVGLNGSPLGWIAVPSGTGTYALKDVGGYFSWLADPNLTPKIYGRGLLSGDGTGTVNAVTNQAASLRLTILYPDGVGGNPTFDVNESALLLQNLGGLLAENQILTNSASHYGQVPPSTTHTNEVYRTDANGNPFWGPIPAFSGTLTPGLIPYASSSSTLADSPISVTGTNEITVGNVVITNSLKIVASATQTNIMGGAGTIVSNWLSAPYILLGTNVLSYTGTGLYWNGTQITVP